MSSAIDKMIDNRLKPVDPPKDLNAGDVYTTHEGILNIQGIELKVYVLNTGQRLIDAESIDKFFK